MPDDTTGLALAAGAPDSNVNLDVGLDDKYTATSGPIFLSGVQALPSE